MIKKISKDEFEKMINKGVSSDSVKSKMIALNVDEGIFIPKKEWKQKSAPTFIAYTIKGYQFITRKVRKGWAILRTE